MFCFRFDRPACSRSARRGRCGPIGQLPPEPRVVLVSESGYQIDSGSRLELSLMVRSQPVSSAPASPATASATRIQSRIDDLRYTASPLFISNSHFPIPDSQFAIPNSRFPIPDSRFPIRDSQFAIPNSQFPIRNSQFAIPDSRFRIPDSGFPIPNSQLVIRDSKAEIPEISDLRSGISAAEPRRSAAARIGSFRSTEPEKPANFDRSSHQSLSRSG